MTPECRLWRSGFRVPYPGSAVPRSCRQSRARFRRKLRTENTFAVARYPRSHASDGLDLEDGLRLRRKRQSDFIWVLNAVSLQDRAQAWPGLRSRASRPRIYYCVGVGDVDPESVRKEV